MAVVGTGNRRMLLILHGPQPPGGTKGSDRAHHKQPPPHAAVVPDVLVVMCSPTSPAYQHHPLIPLQSDDAVFEPGVFTPFGKLMDGWESARRREKGHDWCIIRLGIPGIIRGLLIDTSHFTGNFAPRVSVQAAADVRERELGAAGPAIAFTAGPSSIATDQPLLPRPGSAVVEE